MLRLDVKAFDIRICISEIRQLQNDFSQLSLQKLGIKSSLQLTSLSYCIDNELKGALYNTSWRGETDSAIENISVALEGVQSKLSINDDSFDQIADFSLKFSRLRHLISLFRRFLDEKKRTFGAEASAPPTREVETIRRL